MLFLQKAYYHLCRYFPIIIVILMVLFWLFIYVLNGEKRKTPEIIKTPSISTPELREKLPDISEPEVQAITKEIQKTKEEKAPTYHYYTYTQEDADNKAKKYAEKQNADKVVKTTTVKEIEEPSKGNQEEKTTVIENDYYAINMEKKHNVSVGSMYVDHNSYITASYRNRDVTYTALYGMNNHDVGIGVSVTVAKW